MNIYKNISFNKRRTWILFSVFLIVIIALGWLFSYLFDSYYILLFAVIFSFFMSFLSYWKSDKIVLAMSKARPVKKEDNPELYRILENLSITAGLPMPRLYIVNDPAPNAFATGRDPDNAVVVVTSGLVELLDRSELEGVIAHELSHIGNRDILLQTIVVVLVGSIVLLSDFFLRWSFFGGKGKSSDKGGGQLQVVLMVIGLVAAILTPIIAKLIQLAISRKREYLADASGALLTRYPEGLASALEKISRSPYVLRSANKATAHLYISNPLKGKKGKGLAKLFMTHPSVEDRVKRLRGKGAGAV
ncbi:MAG: zinc metalloprotease HtpX [Candidatus Portnoybacteria bacterium]|nr:zinc metalloprotease HtpX [Candidatus Portnoybacteria bacterium]